MGGGQRRVENGDSREKPAAVMRERAFGMGAIL